jgi:uncharacterized protein
MRGKLSDVQQYLEAGGSPNVLVEVLTQQKVKGEGSSDQPSQQLGSVPLLFCTAGSRHSEVAVSIKLLLHAGAAVDAISNSTGTRDRTALTVACCASHNPRVVQALLGGGADPCHQASSDGNSALHLAAAVGSTESCIALHTASSGRTLELRGKGDGLSATALSAACLMRQYAVVKLVCELGADVDHTSVNGETPLTVAVANEHHDTSILQLLLQQDGIEVDYRSSGGDTALATAAFAGNLAAVKLLLQHGADACSINNGGMSPASFAAAQGHLHVLQLLMQHGVDVRATAAGGSTLLVQAALADQPRIAEFLIEEGLSVHEVDVNGGTALYYAAATTSSGTETMRVLLAQGAGCDVRGRIAVLHYR